MTVIARELDVLTSKNPDQELPASEPGTPQAKKEWMFEDSKAWGVAV